MKRLITLTLLLSIVGFSYSQGNSYTLLLAFSQVDNVYQDENIKVEFYGRRLRITNLTYKNIYINKLASTIKENDYSYNLSTSKEGSETTIEAPLTIGPNGKKDYLDVFRNFGRRGLNANKGMSYSLHRKGKSLEMNKKGGRALKDQDILFLNTVAELYEGLGANQELTSSSMHLTQDESFLNFTASIVYSTDPQMNNSKQITINSWCSDAILTIAYYKSAGVTKNKGLKISKDRNLNDVLHCFTDQPFEYEEDRSPIGAFYISLKDIKKGLLTIDYDISRLASKFETYKITMNGTDNNDVIIKWAGLKNLKDKKQKKEFHTYLSNKINKF